MASGGHIFTCSLTALLDAPDCQAQDIVLERTLPIFQKPKGCPRAHGGAGALVMKRRGSKVRQVTQASTSGTWCSLASTRLAGVV